MGLNRIEVNTLWGGISKQPPDRRHVSQVGDARNVVFDIASGILKRPGSHHLAMISGLDEDASYAIHVINRDAEEKYIVIYGGGVIKVLDVFGREQSVTITDDAAEYLSGALAHDLAMVSVADYTIITNRTMPVSANTSPSYEVLDEFVTYDIMASESRVAGGHYRVQDSEVGRPAGHYLFQPYLLSGSAAEITQDSEYVTLGSDTDFDSITVNDKITIAGRTDGIDGTAVFAVLAVDADNDRVRVSPTPTGDSASVLNWHIGAATYPKYIGASNRIFNRPSGYASAARNPWAMRWKFALADGSIHEANVSANWDGEAFEAMSDVAAAFQEAIREEIDGVRVAWVVEGENSVGHFVVTGPEAGANAKVFPPETSTDPAHLNYHDWSNKRNWVYNPSKSDTATLDGDQDLTDADSFQSPGSRVRDARIVPGTGNPDTQLKSVDEQWVRVPPPGSANAKPDPLTMPVKMVRDTPPTDYEGEYTAAAFTVDTIDWNSRLSGDNDSNPLPRLFPNENRAGRRIADVAFFQNRLVLAGDENVVMSQAGDLFNFYADDAENLTDSDPLDLSISSSGVNLISYVVPFRSRLVLFTEVGNQFELGAADGQPLTPATANIQATTRLRTGGIRPVAMNEVVYFSVPQNNSASIYEYDSTDASYSTAQEVTMHVQGLLPRSLHTLRAASNQQALFCMDMTSNVYVYQTYVDSGRKVQSAWSVWAFGDGEVVVDVGIIADYAFALVKRDGAFYLERFSSQPELPDTGMPHVVYMDRQRLVVGSYDSDTDTTTWDYTIEDDEISSVVLGPDFTLPGNAIGVSRVDSHTLSASGDLSSGPCYVGKPFVMSVELSPPFRRAPNGVSVLDDRLQIRRCEIGHYQSGPYTASATSAGVARHSLYTPARVGQASPDAPLIGGTGRHTFPARGNRDTVVVSVSDDGVLPVVITGLVWHVISRRTA